MTAITSGPSIALCPRCRRQILPQLAQPSWHREKHRAAAAEREDIPDPRAEAIKRRKAQKSQLRKQVRVAGILSAARFFIETRNFAQAKRIDAAQLECPDCLKLQHPDAA